MTKTLQDFYNDLGFRESSGNYKTVNHYGFAGKYQMGEAALADAGYYKKKSQNYNNDWKGQFTGKDGVYSLNDFLENKQAQENANHTFKKTQWRQLKSYGLDKYLGKTINGNEITASGILAAAHLKGPGNVQEYLKSNGRNNPKDRLNTSVEDYIKKFSGYDVSEITGIKENLNYNLVKNIFNFDEYISGQKTDYNKLVKPLQTYLYTVEAIKNMPNEEFSKNWNNIVKQMKTVGVPREKDLKQKNYTTPKNSHWVTINGNHVLIED